MIIIPSYTMFYKFCGLGSIVRKPNQLDTQRWTNCMCPSYKLAKKDLANIDADQSKYQYQ